jgi:hypothetical protein
MVRPSRDLPKPDYRLVAPDDPPDDTAPAAVPFEAEPSPSSPVRSKGKGKEAATKPPAAKPVAVKPATTTAAAKAAVTKAAAAAKASAKATAAKATAAAKASAKAAKGASKKGTAAKAAGAGQNKGSTDTPDANPEPQTVRELDPLPTSINSAVQALNTAWKRHLELFHIENDRKYVQTNQI